jgi:prepilin-type processing-associated H-X9-DG protein
MKSCLRKRRNAALTLPEVLVVIVTLGILVAMFLPVLAAAKRHPSRINCVSNLKQVNLAYVIWAGDHNNKYPMAVSVTNGGAMETIATGDVVKCFICLSNELSTPKVLVCPVEVDLGKIAATDFVNDLHNSNISYFIGVDADEAYPQRILSGDDNFLINGSPIKSGLVQYLTNTSIAWGADRHQFVGNIGYADGSVNALFSPGLQATFLQSDLATNRLAIP